MSQDAKPSIKPCLFKGCSEVVPLNKFPKHLKEHLTQHIKSGQPCVYCGTKVPKHEMGKHLCHHMGLKVYQCPLIDCLKEFFLPKMFEAHIKHHESCKCTTKHCGIRANSVSSLKAHNRAEKNICFRCKTCHFVCRTEKIMVEHNQKNHVGEKIIRCHYCEALVKRKEIENKMHYRGIQAYLKHVQKLHPQKLEFEVEKWKLLQTCDPEEFNWMIHPTVRKNKYIEALWELGYIGERDVKIYFRKANQCQKRMAVIDYVVYHNQRVYLIQIDKYQHKYADLCDEFCRMESVNEYIFSTDRLIPVRKHVVWIRINPDYFVKDGKFVHWRDISVKERVKTISGIMEKYTPKNPLSIIFLYYDSTNKKNERILACDSYLGKYVVPYF